MKYLGISNINVAVPKKQLTPLFYQKDYIDSTNIEVDETKFETDETNTEEIDEA